MLTVTTEAAQYLKRALVGVREPENACFRLRLGQKGADLALDQTRPGDETVEHEGEVLLTLEPSVAQQVTESTLEYNDETSRLVLAGSGS
jgi:hypothetical protein